MNNNEGVTSSFGALREIAQQTQARAENVAVEQDLQTQWTGIGFRLLGVNWVAPMAQITEILEMPPITPLPNVTSWVLGVANVRGRLLPVLNLALFFQKRLLNPKKTHRILVLESDDLYVGLVVDQSFGIQHFKVDDYYDDKTFPSIANDSYMSLAEMDFLAGHYQESVELTQCTQGLYIKNSQCWFVMNMSDLILSDKFLRISSKYL